MSESDPTTEPLETTVDVVGRRATETFALLGNETRLAILIALWEAYEPFDGDRWDPMETKAVPFEKLQDRIGVVDSDQLAYHLAKLEGTFVEATPAGYQLLTIGHNIVRTIISNVGYRKPNLEPTEIDLSCQFCGSRTAITYQNHRLYVVCTSCEGAFNLGDHHPSGLLWGGLMNPTGLQSRTPEEIHAAITSEVHNNFATRTGLVCPECIGELDLRVHICEDHEPRHEAPCPACDRQWGTVARFACKTCKQASTWPVALISFTHPLVEAFAWRHGFELGYGLRDMETSQWVADQHEAAKEELVETDPVQVRITHRNDGEMIQLTFDEELNVIEYTQNY